MSLLDVLLGLQAPYECMGCDQEGKIICHPCSLLFAELPERCYRCRKYSPGSMTCKPCRKMSRLTCVKAVTTYEGVARSMIWKFKFGGVRSAAGQLAKLFPSPPPGVILVPIPTATSRVRRRGYDHTKLLVRALARQTHLPYMWAMARIGQQKQIGASRAQRIKQLQGAFVVKNPEVIRGRHVILVDDVLTTGATLESAALTLRQAGASRVDAFVFAQV